MIWKHKNLTKKGKRNQVKYERPAGKQVKTQKNLARIRSQQTEKEKRFVEKREKDRQIRCRW
jgi:hypothetical protein